MDARHPQDASAAMAPHLQLMADTADADTQQDAAAAGLLLLWLGDDVLLRLNRHLAPLGISENKLHVLLLFRLFEDGRLGAEPPTRPASPTISASPAHRPPACWTGWKNAG